MSWASRIYRSDQMLLSKFQLRKIKLMKVGAFGTSDLLGLWKWGDTGFGPLNHSLRTDSHWLSLVIHLIKVNIF